MFQRNFPFKQLEVYLENKILKYESFLTAVKIKLVECDSFDQVSVGFRFKTSHLRIGQFPGIEINIFSHWLLPLNNNHAAIISEFNFFFKYRHIITVIYIENVHFFHTKLGKNSATYEVHWNIDTLVQCHTRVIKWVVLTTTQAPYQTFVYITNSTWLPLLILYLCIRPS